MLWQDLQDSCRRNKPCWSLWGAPTAPHRLCLTLQTDSFLIYKHLFLTDRDYPRRVIWLCGNTQHCFLAQGVAAQGRQVGMKRGTMKAEHSAHFSITAFTGVITSITRNTEERWGTHRTLDYLWSSLCSITNKWQRHGVIETQPLRFNYISSKLIAVEALDTSRTAFVRWMKA